MSQENDAPKRIEQEIDAALRTLAEVQAPAAMTSRIHRNLAAADHPARSRWPLWVPTSCAAVGVVLLAVLLQTHVTRGKQTFTAETAKMVQADSALHGRVTTRPTSVPVVSVERKEEVSNVHQNFRRRDRTQYRHTANLLSYPLTRQEKLLLRFVQTAKPADLQALNPEYQAKVEAQQEAAFAAYLKSGNTQKTETDQSTQE